MIPVVIPDFIEFPKIARLSRECFITEKIDGTNGQIFIGEDGTFGIGSRNRWLSLEADNFGFCAWALEHRDELVAGLGPGRHYGEWWGRGIQRGYGLIEKRFSLFNSERWGETRPACCSVVPLLFRGTFDTDDVFAALENLQLKGSVAAPGFMKPEGIIVYHTAGNVYFKKTIEKDTEHKGKVNQ